MRVSPQRILKLAQSPAERRRVAIGRARPHFFRLAKHFTPAIAVDAGDVRYFVSTRDPFIGFYTYLNGSFDADALEHGLSLLQAATNGSFSVTGRTVVDIGANIGTQTIPFLSQRSAGRVIAIEPDRANATLLRQNVIANGLQDRTQVLELAATDFDGTVQLEQSAINPGDHRVHVSDSSEAAHMGEDQRVLIDVRAARLDTLIEEGTIPVDDVALIWMDTQGHEGQVLAGATKLLGRVPIITEYWPYGLRRAGGLDTFHTLVAEHFEAVIDLQSAAPNQAPQRLPASDVASLASRYTANDDSRASTTDLLLLPRATVS